MFSKETEIGKKYELKLARNVRKQEWSSKVYKNVPSTHVFHMGREQKKDRKLCSKICQTEWKAIFLIKVNESLTHVNNDKIFVKGKHFFLLPRVLRDKYGGVFVSSWNVPRNETSFPDIYFFPAVCYILLGRLMISDEILFALKENAVKQFWNGIFSHFVQVQFIAFFRSFRRKVQNALKYRIEQQKKLIHLVIV